jgi:hypothetical protein
MRLLYFLLPAVGLLAGCADRLRVPAADAQVRVHVGYAPPARRAAEDADHAFASIPNFDMRKSCRAAERDSCVGDERNAKAELQRRWSTFSGAHRAECIPFATGGVEPSYVEILSCFEIAVALKEGPSTYPIRAQCSRHLRPVSAVGDEADSMCSP